MKLSENGHSVRFCDVDCPYSKNNVNQIRNCLEKLYLCGVEKLNNIYGRDTDYTGFLDEIEHTGIQIV